MSLQVEVLIEKLKANHLLDVHGEPLFRQLVAESDSDYVTPEAPAPAASRIISEEKIAKLDATAAERGFGFEPKPEPVAEPVAEEAPAEGEAANG